MIEQSGRASRQIGVIKESKALFLFYLRALFPKYSRRNRGSGALTVGPPICVNGCPLPFCAGQRSHRHVLTAKASCDASVRFLLLFAEKTALRPECSKTTSTR
jgi:hypothetical protein